MKMISLLALFSLLIGANYDYAYAQKLYQDKSPVSFNVSSWQVGMKVGYGRGDLLRNRNSFQFHSGYYVINKLLLGATGTWSKEWAGNFNFHDFSAGPYIRYHFTATRISPFFEASHQFGRRTSGDGSSVSYPSISIRSTQISPGISVGLLSSLRVEVNYNLQWIYFPNRTQLVALPQFGLAYLFR